jgi:hypothetical protein
VAVLVRVVPVSAAPTVALMLIAWLAPAAKVVKTQVTVPLACVQGLVADVKVTPAGRGSVTVAICASAGPWFVAVTVQLIALPAITVAGPTLVKAMSPLSIVAVAVAVLLSGLGSEVVEVTFALLTRVRAVTSGLTSTTTVTVTLAPLASGPRVHFTGTSPHVPWGVAEARLVPGGRMSVTVASSTLDGPWLVTVRV